MYKLFFKRLIDIIAAIIMLLLLLPLLLILVLVLAYSNKGTPFFVQKRPGKNEKIFSIIKLKTMNDEKDSNGILLPDAERLTTIGKIIRKTSLDEVPQLLNVVKGDMSFIGPRPLLVRYLPYYTALEKNRHSVRPGITGLAQVSGRNMLQWDDRLAKDIYYVQNLSFIGDMKIIIKTIKNVLNSKGVVIDPNSLLKDLDEERK